MPLLRSAVAVSTLVGALVVGSPATAAADTITFDVTDPVSFGLLPFELSSPFSNGAFDGSIQLTSGPATVVVDDVNGLTHYSFGPGTVTIFLESDFDPVSGLLTGVTLPFAFTVCEGCDLMFGGGTATGFDITFSGVIDLALAQYLGVVPFFDGSIGFGLEAIDGGPDSDVRSGFDHRGGGVLEIDVVEAPEPAALLLMAGGLAGFMARRRMRSRYFRAAR
jgi:hypothetical protein